MSRHWTLGLLTYGPFALALIAWAGQILLWRRQKPGWMTLLALGLFGASASLAAWTFFSYDFRLSSNQAPWRDPEILNFGLLFFPVLVEMILAFGAILRGAPKSMMAMVGIGSLPLLFLSVMAVGAF